MFKAANFSTNIFRTIQPSLKQCIFHPNLNLINRTRNPNESGIKIIHIRSSKFISIFTRMNSSISDNTDSLPAEVADDEQTSGAKSFGSLDSLDEDTDTLNGLRDAYDVARQESISKWLDYKKTCYIYLYQGGGEPSETLAAFDLDGTIIKPKSNKRIPRSATDWQFFSAWTRIKVNSFVRENQARFVIFTNQNGVGLRLVALEEVQERIELVTKRLNIPCTVFVAIDKDEFRKPRTGMFRLLSKSFNNSLPINYEKSFYCGDAIGYPSHSDADIKFAQTLGLPFLAPDKFVRGVKPKLLDTTKKIKVTITND